MINQPYPITDYYAAPWLLLKSFLYGVFVAAFLYLFKPFGITSEVSNLHLMGYGFITFFVCLLFNFVIVRLFPTFFKEETWTVGKEIISVFCILFLIIIGNSIYSILFFNSSFTWGLLFFNIGSVFGVGLFIIVFSVLSNYVLQLKKHKVSQIELPVISNNAKSIELHSENKDERLTLLVDSIFCLESADNYSIVYYEEELKPKNTILRGSLKYFEKQLPEGFFRCHRSYIVNLAMVNEITGNAQGYKFNLINSTKAIPVSRSHNNFVREQFKLKN